MLFEQAADSRADGVTEQRKRLLFRRHKSQLDAGATMRGAVSGSHQRQVVQRKRPARARRLDVGDLADPPLTELVQQQSIRRGVVAVAERLGLGVRIPL